MRARAATAIVVLCLGGWVTVAPEPVASASVAKGWEKVSTSIGAAMEWRGVDGIADDDVLVVGRSDFPHRATSSHWDGASWTKVQVSDRGWLDAVDLRTATDGWAVGFLEGKSQPQIVRWNGTAWSPSSAPAPGHTNELHAVSALSATDAWAAGRFRLNGGSWQALLLRWSGSSWTQIDMSGLGYPSLYAVEAIGTSDVWIGGTTASGRPATAHWDGASWTPAAVPDVGDGMITDFAAFGTGGVWVTGWRRSAGDARRHALVASWSSSRWNVVKLPTRWGNGDYLEAIDGTTPHDMWVVGGTQLAGGASSTLSLHRGTDGWSVLPTANGPHFRGSLDDVASISPSDVWSVGDPSQRFHAGVAHDATVTLNAPGKGSVGQRLRLEGIVETTQRVFPGGWIVHLSRRDPDGTIVRVGTAAVDDEGGFTLRDRPRFRGVARYEATLRAPPPFSSTGDTDATKVKGRTTSVDLTAARRRIRYGEEAELLIHVGQRASGRRVRLYATPVGRSSTLVAAGNVNDDGYLKVRVKPKWNTFYVATFVGDEVFEPAASDRLEIYVQVEVHTKMVEVDRVSGRYAIYDYDRDCPAPAHEGCPSVKTWFTPSYPRSAYRITLQVLSQGRWVTTVHPWFHLSSSGAQVVHFYYSRDDTTIGLPWRARSAFHGNRYVLGGRSDWVYYKVVR